MSKAKYWDHPWNPVVGCRKASEGCEHCYAERMTGKFNINGGDFSPRAMTIKNPPKSGVVFTGNMTDLFGEWNSREQIVLWLGSLEHYTAVNLILTKRAERMASLLTEIANYERMFPVGKSFLDKFWFGVTAENQVRAEERIPHLLKAPVQKRWLSLEPLLGPISFRWAAWHDYSQRGIVHNHLDGLRGVNWVVVGAESGPDARECKIEWVESIVEQCREAGVPVFVKQLHIGGKMVADINKFPEHLQIRETPWKGNHDGR